MRDTVIGELKNTFRPEFLNRVDDIIVFNKLSDKDIEVIARRMLNNLTKRLKELEISVEFTDEAVKAVSKEGFDDVYGARPLRRVIQTKIEDKLSEYMLEKKLPKNKNLICRYKDNQFTFEEKR